MAFRPNVHQKLTIDDFVCLFTEHPAAPGMPYGQTGRRATVYQVQANGTMYALKVFTQAFRSAQVAANVEMLSALAKLPGLQVCQRVVLTPQRHATLLAQQPDLSYAVLMAWVTGETWQELLLGGQPLAPAQCLALAQRLTHVLATMEARRIAHCDLSGPNLLVHVDPPKAMLVDVEDLFGPGLARPEKLPGGSPGYAHKTAPQGLWSAAADRFAGALLLAEMLGWCDKQVRQVAYSEQYFDPDEMQQNSERYHLLLDTLRRRWGGEIGDLFARAWYGNTLEECPQLAEWDQAIRQIELTLAMPRAQANKRFVFKPVTLPPEARLAQTKIEAAEAWLEMNQVDRALAELGEAALLAPQLAAPVQARAYLQRGAFYEQTGNLKGALAVYEAALYYTSDEKLKVEIETIIAELTTSLSAQASQARVEQQKAHAVQIHLSQRQAGSNPAGQLVTENGQVLVLYAGKQFLGRDTSNNIIIHDAQVSRRHALLHVTAGGVQLEDLDSTNGTFVDGVRLVPHTPKHLYPGNVLHFGQVALRFEGSVATSPSAGQSICQEKTKIVDRTHSPLAARQSRNNKN